MVSRRNFLKLLSALPAVSALPAMAQVADQLPLEDVTITTESVSNPGPELSDEEIWAEFHYPADACKVFRRDAAHAAYSDSWLKINGVPVGLKSMRLESEQEYIRMSYWSPHHNSTMHASHPGIRTHKLFAVLVADNTSMVGLKDGFMAGERLHLVAQFGRCGEFRGEGMLLSYTLTIGTRTEVSVEFYLPDVQWVEYK